MSYLLLAIVVAAVTFLWAEGLGHRRGVKDTTRAFEDSFLKPEKPSTSTL